MPLTARRGEPPDGGSSQQRLDLADQRALSVQRHGDRGAGDRCRPLIQEEVRRVGDVLDSVVVQHETPDLVGRAESVLDPADHPQRAVAVAFEMQHHVDEMFQRARSGDGPVLGDVADEDQRDAVGLRGGGQRGGDRAHLRDAAGDAVGLGGGHGLHRVHDDQRGLDRRNVVQHRVQVGLGGQVNLVSAAADAVGAQPDLAGGLLTGDIQRAPARLRPAMGDLEQQRRLAHAGIARQQRDRTGHHAAPEHPVEFADARRAVLADVRLDGADRNGSRTEAEPGRATAGATDRAEHRHLIDGAPGAALQAAAHPFGGDMSAFRAAVLRARICHAMTVSGRYDKPRCDRPVRPAQICCGGPNPAEIGTITLACPAFSKLNVKL